MTTLVTAAELAELAEQIHLAIQERGGERPPLDVEFVSLAGYFRGITRAVSSSCSTTSGRVPGGDEQMLGAALRGRARALREASRVPGRHEDNRHSWPETTRAQRLRDTLHGISVATQQPGWSPSEMQEFIRHSARYRMGEAPADSDSHAAITLVPRHGH